MSLIKYLCTFSIKNNDNIIVTILRLYRKATLMHLIIDDTLNWRLKIVYNVYNLTNLSGVCSGWI